MKVVSPFVLVYHGDMDELVSDQWYWWDLYLGLRDMRLWVWFPDALDAVFEGHEGGAE